MYYSAYNPQVFHLMKFCTELGKIPQKVLHLVETRIFYEFLEIENSALFHNTTEQQNDLKKSG